MKEQFLSQLKDANGRSEFVIVVVADIRGFSEFSRHNESPNIAMFMKRFYSRIVIEYFPECSFVKPTGDGLVMTFGYSESNLLEVCGKVMSSVLRCISDFPTLCKGDPMINFRVPDKIGFGVSRGTACCLYSGSETIDYSGHLLNLASRLTDLARPGGVVVDGAFLPEAIPADIRTKFSEGLVYIRGIAEEAPVEILFLEGAVAIPEHNLKPLAYEHWENYTHSTTLAKFMNLNGSYTTTLPKPIKDKGKVSVELIYPNKKAKGYSCTYALEGFICDNQGKISTIEIELKPLQELLVGARISPKDGVSIKYSWVPRI